MTHLVTLPTAAQRIARKARRTMRGHSEPEILAAIARRLAAHDRETRRAHAADHHAFLRDMGDSDVLDLSRLARSARA